MRRGSSRRRECRHGTVDRIARAPPTSLCSSSAEGNHLQAEREGSSFEFFGFRIHDAQQCERYAGAYFEGISSRRRTRDVAEISRPVKRLTAQILQSARIRQSSIVNRQFHTMQTLSITWFGHSTFLLRTPGGKRVLFDPWLRENPSCPEALKKPPKVDVILVSHGHSDHIGDLVAVRPRERGDRSSASSSCATGSGAKDCRTSRR